MQCRFMVLLRVTFRRHCARCCVLLTLLASTGAGAGPIVITNVVDNPTSFFTFVTGAGVSHFPPFFQIHSLVDIPGTPWVSNSRIVESAGFTADSLSVTWDMQHILGPHAEDVNPNPAVGLLSLSFTPTAAGVFSLFTTPFPVPVTHPITNPGTHFDLLFLSMAVNVGTGVLGHLDINGYTIDYRAEHCEGNGVTTPCTPVPGGVGGMNEAPEPTALSLVMLSLLLLPYARRLPRG